MSDFTDAELESIRQDFPLLTHKGRGGSSIAYFDSAATSQKPGVVIDALRNFYEKKNGAVHRGTHLLADEATQSYEDARDSVAAFFGVDSSTIVWTKNATEGINVIAYSLLHASLDGRDMRGKTHSPVVFAPGDNIVVSRAEHHANLLPWQMLSHRLGIELRPLNLTCDGLIDTSDLSVIDERTRLVAFTHASNVTGAISPVEQLIERAHRHNSLVMLDTCQSSAHIPVDFSQLHCNFAVASSHKMMGPTGLGILYICPELKELLPPVLSGGDMIADVEFEQSTFQSPPVRFEAGSQPVAQTVGLAAALRYMDRIGRERIAEHEHAMTQLLIENLLQLPYIRLLGSTDPQAKNRLGVVSFEVDKIHPHDVGQVLDRYDIAVRVGHHCALPLHKHFGLRASTRASISLTTTKEEVYRLIEGLQKVHAFFECHES